MTMPLPQTNTGFSGFHTKRTRWDDNIPWYEIPSDGQWHMLRFFGPVMPIASHWIQSNRGQKTRFPMLCLNFDNTVGSYTKAGGCTVCDEFDPKSSEDKEIKEISPRMSGYSHAIIRKLQSDTTTIAWRPMRLPMSIIIALQSLKSMNSHNIDGVTYQADVSDPYYGMDVYIMYNSAASTPQTKYQVQRGNHTPLTPTETGYLNQLYDWPKLIIYPPIAEVKEALVSNGYYQKLHPGSTPIIMGASLADSTLPQLNQGVQRIQNIQAPLPGVQQPFMVPPPPAFNPMPPPVYQQAPAPYAQPPQVVQAPQPQQFQPPQGPGPTEASYQSQPPQFQPPQDTVYGVVGLTPSQPFVLQTQQAPAYAQPPQAFVQPNAVQAPQAPQAPAYAQPVGQAPQPSQGVPPQGGTPKVFSYPGSQGGVSGDEFQRIIGEFGGRIQRGTPLKVCDRDELIGMQVLACFGKYVGDNECIKCPIRKMCLRA